MDIIFDLSSARASVVGTMTRALVPVLDPSVELLGVRFRPGEAPRFLRAPASEARDASLDLSALWGPAASELAERLAGAKSSRARIETLERELGRRLGSLDARSARSREALALVIAARGELRIAELSARLGLGTRQLERTFQELTGVTPKEFARIVRFRAVLDAIARSPSPPLWAALALEFGYYDQAHLVREFQSLAGLSPTALLREMRMSPFSKTAVTRPLIPAKEVLR
jgi:AraC-like DNA-binding protein